MYDVVERLGLLGQLLDYPGERLAYRYPEVGANPAAGKDLGIGVRADGVVCIGLAAAKVGNITTLFSCTDDSS